MGARSPLALRFLLTGVRQGCLLSPFLFLLPADWITRKTTANKINGIQWTLLTNELDALSYADDLALLSHKLWQLQGKTSDLDSNSAQLGLNIHRRKTKILRLNTTTEHPVTLRGGRCLKTWNRLGIFVEPSTS